MSIFTEFTAEEKVALSSLPLPETEDVTITIGEQEIKVHTTIPYEFLFLVLQETLGSIINEYGYISGAVYEVMCDLHILKYYTNLNINLETTDPLHFYSDYDILKPHIPTIFAAINPQQLEFFNTTLEKTLHYVIAFRNSIAGILDTLKGDTNDLQISAEELEKTVTNPETLSKLKEIINTVSTDKID